MITGNSTDNSTSGWALESEESMDIIPEIKEHI